MMLYTDGDSEELNHSEIIKNRKQAYKHLDSLHALIQKNLASTADDMDSSVPTIDIYSLRAITKLRYPDIILFILHVLSRCASILCAYLFCQTF